nr:DUF2085 domain-containing protein [uncultured Oscillibacter sp.]
MPERSFFFRGKQFPVCARCTGVFLGMIAFFLSFHWLRPPVWVIPAFCGMMLLDWGIQALKLRESTNFRRVITGSLCGYALSFGILRLARWFLF